MSGFIEEAWILTLLPSDVAIHFEENQASQGYVTWKREGYVITFR